MTATTFGFAGANLPVAFASANCGSRRSSLALSTYWQWRAPGGEPFVAGSAPLASGTTSSKVKVAQHGFRRSVVDPRGRTGVTRAVEPAAIAGIAGREEQVRPGCTVAGWVLGRGMFLRGRWQRDCAAVRPWLSVRGVQPPRGIERPDSGESHRTRNSISATGTPVGSSSGQAASSISDTPLKEKSAWSSTRALPGGPPGVSDANRRQRPQPTEASNSGASRTPSKE